MFALFYRGGYHNPLGGCSHILHATEADNHVNNGSNVSDSDSDSDSASASASGEWQFSGYRRHDEDLLFFPSGGFNMSWRCGEPGAGNPTDCTTFTYSLVYEW